MSVARLLYQQPELMLADEPVSSLDPSLARQTLQVLINDADARDATLIVSLHAVDLALACFPRIVGVRDGRVAFDCAAAEVDENLLTDLYAAEGRNLPTQDNQPLSNPNALTVPASRQARCA